MIQIKDPCDANWQEMTPAESGKYCGACEKVVVDFSKMSDAQIKNYFTEYASQKTCGRFLDSQLNRPLIVKPATRFDTFLNHLHQIPATRTILFFITSASMWISSCVRNNTENILTGDTIAVDVPHDTTLIPTDPVNNQQNNLLIDPDDQVMGEITPHQTIKMFPQTVLMGDICVSPDEPDTVAVTFPAATADTSDATLHLIKGKVQMTDTISQKIKRMK